MLGKLAKNLPGTAIQGGAGAASYYVQKALYNIEFVQKNPYLGPLGMLFIGHALKTSEKLKTAGAAMCGAGGYAAALIYEMKKATPKPAETKGFYETGALTPASDIGALVEPSDIGNLPEAANAFEDVYDLSSF